MSSIGVNLRVTGHCSQGGRKYMEDTFSVAYQQTEDLKDLEYAYFGIFDGHGGPEAALYAKDHLIDAIVSQSCFWSECDEDVLRAIHDGYIQTHYAMWKYHETWPRIATGLPSTSGTTATVAFIKKGKIYIGHVGDSCIVLGYQDKGDFWSYNSASDKFVVSPEPDVSVHPVDVESFRCLILGTDGLWNMLSPAVAVAIVQATENHNEKQVVYPPDQFVMQYINEISSTETNVFAKRSEQKGISCDKRKHTDSSVINTNSYNFRLKQKLGLPEKDDERNSDVENMEQWSQRWSEVPSSSSQCSVKKSKSKRRRCSFEQNSEKPLNWSCSNSLSISSSDKSPAHNKQKSLQERKTRILRSDTVANTPIRTLRSRNIDLSSAMKLRNEEIKTRTVNSKICIHPSTNSKTKCIRPPSFSCPSNKKLKITSFGPSSIITRRNASKRIIK
ncbi:hypothetical protein PGB90_005123 [Kerria lacca]